MCACNHPSKPQCHQRGNIIGNWVLVLLGAGGPVHGSPAVAAAVVGAASSSWSCASRSWSWSGAGCDACDAGGRLSDVAPEPG